MDAEPAMLLSERDFRFALGHQQQLFDRMTELQKDREAWIRHSIIATFAFFGWIAVYRDDVTDTFMLDMVSVQLVYFVPLIFNLGGALRFFFIERDVIRLARYLTYLERDILNVDRMIAANPYRDLIRERAWHPPSICYWLFIVLFSALLALVLTLRVHL